MKLWQGAMLALGLLVLAGFVVSSKVKPEVFFQVQDPGLLFVSFALQSVSIGVIALRMGFFLKSLNHETMQFWKLFEIEFANKFVYYVFPSRVNVPAKAFFLDRVFGITKTKGLSITTFEYTLDTSILLVLSLFGLLFFLQGAPHLYLEQVLLVTGAIGIGLAAYFLFPAAWFEHVKGWTARLPGLAAKTGGWLVDFFANARRVWLELVFSRQIFMVTAIIFAYWLLQVYSLSLLFSAYGVSPPGLLQISLVYAISLALSGLTQIPGGLGVREAALGTLFVFVGIQLDIGVAVALMLRAFTIFPILAGYLAAARLGFSQKNGNGNEKGTP